MWVELQSTHPFCSQHISRGQHAFLFFAFGVKHLSKLRSIPAHSWRCSWQVAAEEFGAYGGHRSSELFLRTWQP